MPLVLPKKNGEGNAMTLTAEEKQKMLEAQRAYMAEYRKKPGYKEKAKQYKERYWLKKAAEQQQAD